MANEYDDVLRREIVTTRVFDAPRAMVFEAWTDPEQLKVWWGPRGFSNTFHEFEMKPGGTWRFTMHGPNGTNYENECRIVEITPPERIVIEHVSPPKFRLTAIFDELGTKTKLTFRQLFESPEVYGQIKRLAGQGNEDNLDRLANFLAELKTKKC
ncbi:uncharacterized protein YndB with AHSA1/START domain [Granulicella aggregans]|uniref:Uncharacterized protein YndB with AHSA1/START domain n=1 Tax=Granulicella aggregans TaxID=474949 RepID=A0A7W7ZA64_9BACT|nr:SRPBCC family protein [Granulicella aggregans]MBB5056125.1 uncharacterized protein YndB with AHSA1/START domain [Granulicella aggregans]